MPLARDKLGDLDATERRNLRQRRAEVDGALEGSVLRRVRVQPDLRRVVDAWLRVGRVELRNERALWVRVRGRRRCDGGEEEWVDPLGLARLLLRRPVDLVLTLVRFEADGEGAAGELPGCGGARSVTERTPSCPFVLAERQSGRANERPREVSARRCDAPADNDTNLRGKGECQAGKRQTVAQRVRAERRAAHFSPLSSLTSVESFNASTRLSPCRPHSVPLPKTHFQPPSRASRVTSSGCPAGRCDALSLANTHTSPFLLRPNTLPSLVGTARMRSLPLSVFSTPPSPPYPAPHWRTSPRASTATPYVSESARSRRIKVERAGVAEGRLTVAGTDAEEEGEATPWALRPQLRKTFVACQLPIPLAIVRHSGTHRKTSGLIAVCPTRPDSHLPLPGSASRSSAHCCCA